MPVWCGLMILPSWALPVAIGGALIASHLMAYNHGVSVEKARHEAIAGKEAEKAAGELSEAYAQRDKQIAEVEFQRSALEKELEKALDESRARDDRIAAGTQRVYVRAQCPDVSATATDAGRPSQVAAELDPRYRHVVSRLRARALIWETWGKKCQAELQSRSEISGSQSSNR